LIVHKARNLADLRGCELRLFAALLVLHSVINFYGCYLCLALTI
jgi:hypothetical protein